MINPEFLSRFVSPSSMWCNLPVTIDVLLLQLIMSWIKLIIILTLLELKSDGLTFFIHNSGATRRVTVGPRLSSIYTFNCLEIYFFQLHSTMFRQWNDGEEKTGILFSPNTFLPIVGSQIKLWLFESRFCWGVRRDSSKTGNVESNHAAAGSFS